MKRFNYKKKNTCLTMLFLLWFLVAFSQHTIIPTGTTTNITLKKTENTIVINGSNNFFAKCTGNCDQLILLNPPGPLNSFNGYLNVLDTNRFYVSSYATGSGLYHPIISKSIDGGQTWTTILDTISDFFTVGLFVFDTSNIVLSSTQGRTFITNDGGENWAVGPQNGMPTTSGSLKINDSTAIVGVLQRLRTTIDRGNSWVGSSFLQANPSSFYAKTLDSIYIVSEGPSGVYFSYIFGQSLVDRVDKNIPMIDPIGLYVVSKDEIYVTGKGWPQETGRIMKTTDLGNTWSYYNVPETEKLLEMVFLNDSMALIGGYNGKLIKWNKNSPMTEWGLGITENSNGIVLAIAYPNPVSQHQELEIHTVTGEQIEIQLVDLQGRLCGLVYSGLAESDKKSVSVDLSHLDSGIYVYHLQVGDRAGHVRFVKQ